MLKKLTIFAAALSGTALPAQQAADAVRRNSELPSAACAPATGGDSAAQQQPPPVLIEGLG